MKLLIPAVLAVMAWYSLPQARGAAGPYEDVPIGALPAEAVKGVLQKTLSPQGRFVILAATGMVRVFDNPAKIAEARGALEALQNAPALVSFVMAIKTGMHRVTTTTTTGQDVGFEFPVPVTYAPPQVERYGRGYVVVPATPTSFTTEQPGVQVTTQQTAVEGGVLHRFSGSTVFPRPVAVTVCTKVPDPAALHDWAVKNGAVPQNEPAWTAARSEILVTPEHADNGMVLNLQPQIVVAGGDGAPRVIPLRVCSASVVVKQGTPVTFDGFPGADADFYQAFLGAPESTGDALTSVSVGAAMDYMTQPAVQQ